MTTFNGHLLDTGADPVCVNCGASGWDLPGVCKKAPVGLDEAHDPEWRATAPIAEIAESLEAYRALAKAAALVEEIIRNGVKIDAHYQIHRQLVFALSEARRLDPEKPRGVCDCLPCLQCGGDLVVCAKCGKCTRHDNHTVGCEGCDG